MHNFFIDPQDLSLLDLIFHVRVWLYATTEKILHDCKQKQQNDYMYIYYDVYYTTPDVGLWWP